MLTSPTGDGRSHADLLHELECAHRIIDALVERVESVTDFRASDTDGTNYRNVAFSVFETAVAWDLRVRARTADQFRALNELSNVLAELNAAKADLESANIHLQRENRERLAAEQALLEAKLLAERLNIEKTKILAAASHDLIQPLNAARLFVSALGHHALPAASLDLVGHASSALDSVEEILEALLEISRLDSGAINPSIVPIDLDALLHNLSAEFAPFAEQKKLGLQIETSGLWARSDARLLRRVLQNLISNALRYTDEGEVCIAAVRRGRQIIVTVADTGRGIPSKHRQMIFREFTRLDERRDATGVGLGLAIVDRAVRMLGHRLTLESRVGTGSRFRLWLPAEAARSQPDSLPPPDVQDSLQGARILVVENETSSREALATLLSGWGCIVAAAANLREAEGVCRAAAEAPQLLIADYHLDHGMTGDRLIDAIRRQLGRTLPAIVVTADRSEDIRKMAVGRSFSLISKPINAAKLRSTIKLRLRP